MGELRQMMVDCMRVRGYSRKTIAVYTSCVKRCAYYYMKSPADLSTGEIERFLLFLRDENKSDSTIQIYYVALKHFYGMLGLGHRMPRVSFPRRGRILPEMLSKEEVFGLITGCPSLKYRTILSMIYSAGLRISEVASLRVTDVDFGRGEIFVREGKYKKSRYTVLARGLVLRHPAALAGEHHPPGAHRRDEHEQREHLGEGGREQPIPAGQPLLVVDHPEHQRDRQA